jgi:hypothetical protein
MVARAGWTTRSLDTHVLEAVEFDQISDWVGRAIVDYDYFKIVKRGGGKCRKTFLEFVGGVVDRNHHGQNGTFFD